MFKPIAILLSLFAFTNAALVRIDAPGLIETDPAAINRHLATHLGFEKEVIDAMDPPERHLQSCQCSLSDNLYSGDCPGLSSRKEDSWCAGTAFGDVCCAEGESGCCEATPGGVVLSVFVIIASIVFCSCACCKCCPLYEKLCCAPKDGSASAQGPPAVQAVAPPKY